MCIILQIKLPRVSTLISNLLQTLFAAREFFSPFLRFPVSLQASSSHSLDLGRKPRLRSHFVSLGTISARMFGVSRRFKHFRLVLLSSSRISLVRMIEFGLLNFLALSMLCLLLCYIVNCIVAWVDTKLIKLFNCYRKLLLGCFIVF